MKKANLYVASVSQYKELLGYSLDGYDASDDADSCSAKRLLDVGSGTGKQIIVFMMTTTLYSCMLC